MCRGLGVTRPCVGVQGAIRSSSRRNSTEGAKPKLEPVTEGQPPAATTPAGSIPRGSSFLQVPALPLLSQLQRCALRLETATCSAAATSADWPPVSDCQFCTKGAKR